MKENNNKDILCTSDMNSFEKEKTVNIFNKFLDVDETVLWVGRVYRPVIYFQFVGFMVILSIIVYILSTGSTDVEGGGSEEASFLFLFYCFYYRFYVHSAYIASKVGSKICNYQEKSYF